MKSKDADILIVPGYGNSGPLHWQTRWEQALSTASRIEQDDWLNPDRDAWVARLAEGLDRTERPVVLVAHSLGIATVLQALPHMRKPVVGAFLVAPPDLEDPKLEPRHLARFGPYPRDPLPFPSITVGSRNDPYCAFEVAEELAAAWGSLFIDAGEAGHINADSGYGPWPEGTLAFGKLISRL